MVDQPSEPPSDAGLREFLADLRTRRDRRSHTERRQHERRGVDLQTEEERRSLVDRRSATDRRRQGERRRPVVSQFSLVEARLIQQMVERPDGAVACPRCDGNLMLGPSELHAGVGLREVHCTGCRHSVVIVETP